MPKIKKLHWTQTPRGKRILKKAKEEKKQTKVILKNVTKEFLGESPQSVGKSTNTVDQTIAAMSSGASEYSRGYERGYENGRKDQLSRILVALSREVNG